MKQCLFLIGLPGSGKSTFAKDLLTKEPAQWVYISSDIYIEEKMKAENISYNEAYKKYLDSSDKNMRLTIAKALKDGKNMIWDQTNVFSSARIKKIKNLNSQKYSVTGIWFNLTEDEQKKRFLSRNSLGEKVLSLSLFEKMKNDFSPPQYSEGFALIKSIDDNGNTSTLVNPLKKNKI